MNSHFGSRVAPERSGMFCAILVALAPALPEYFPGYCTPIPGIVHPCRTGDPVDLFLLARTDRSTLYFEKPPFEIRFRENMSRTSLIPLYLEGDNVTAVWDMISEGGVVDMRIGGVLASRPIGVIIRSTDFFNYDDHMKEQVDSKNDEPMAFVISQF